MSRENNLTMDWWMHELYRCIKSFIHNPTEDMQSRLVKLLSEYRSFHESRNNQSVHDEHEQLMDYQ